jgi:hypothetical protein
MTNKEIALEKLQGLRGNYCDEDILNYIMKNYLSGDEALKAMDYAEGEFYQNGEDEEEEEN